MGTNLPRKIDIQKVLPVDNKQLFGQVDPLLNTNENLNDFQVLEIEKPIISEIKHHYLPGETIPNDVLFYQQVNWLSDLNLNDDPATFPFSEKQLISESKYHYLSGEPILNEDVFYQHVNWINE